MLTRVRHRASLLGVLALSLCAACSSDPDVVATYRGGALPYDEKEKCEEGDYKGRFFTWPSDGGAGELSLSGTIEFSMVKSQRGGEFLELGPNTKLAGEDSKAGAEFTADVVVGRCVAGSYETRLENGLFLIGKTASGEPALTVPFEGTITGAYSRALRAFSGRWDTVTRCFVDPESTCSALSGGWVAALGSQ